MRRSRQELIHGEKEVAVKLRRALTAVAMAAFVLGALAAVWTGQAEAQYPEPIADVIIAVDDTTAGPGDDVSVTATVLDTNGDVVVGASCTFVVGEQPGADATVDAGPFTTNEDGQVQTTLHTGSTAGPIVVEASCTIPDCPGASSVGPSGLSSAQSTCTIGANATVTVGQTQPPGSEAEPPASLPDTGSGGDSDGGRLAWAFVALGTGAVLTVVAAYQLRRRTGR